MLGAHASLRAGREGFKKPRWKCDFIQCNRLYAAKRNVARKDACAPSEERFFKSDKRSKKSFSLEAAFVEEQNICRPLNGTQNIKDKSRKIFVNGFRKHIALIDKGKKAFKTITGDIMNKIKLTTTQLFAAAFLLCGLIIIQTPAAPTLRANGKIAFTSDRDGNSEIYVMNADGSGQTRLTNSPDSEDYPTWSPDGSKIAFVKQNGGVFSINLMNADGTNQTELSGAGLRFPDRACI